jgi:hypothetical protein
MNRLDFGKFNFSIYYNIDGIDPMKDFTPKVNSNGIDSIEMEDYDTFFKKQCLPKNMRKINMKIFNMKSRTTAENLTSKLMAQVPNGKKKMIEIKYHLKKMEKQLTNGRTAVNQMIQKAGISIDNKKRNFKA